MFDVCPARLVEVGGGAAPHHLVLELGLGVLQQEPDRLGELQCNVGKEDMKNVKLKQFQKI